MSWTLGTSPSTSRAARERTAARDACATLSGGSYLGRRSGDEATKGFLSESIDDEMDICTGQANAARLSPPHVNRTDTAPRRSIGCPLRRQAGAARSRGKGSATHLACDDRAMVRIYRVSDRGDVARILGGLRWDEQFVAGQLHAVDRLSKEPTAAVFVQDEGGSIHGFVSVELHEWNSLAQLQGLAVDEAHRRRGTATALVAAAEKFARDAGARGIYMDTPTNNQAGRAFYESRGYSADYVMSRYYADDLDGVTYVRFFAR